MVCDEHKNLESFVQGWSRSWADLSTQQIGMYCFDCILWVVTCSKFSFLGFSQKKCRNVSLMVWYVVMIMCVCVLKCISSVVGWSRTPLTNLEWWPQMMWEKAPSAKKQSQLQLCRMVILDSVCSAKWIIIF